MKHLIRFFLTLLIFSLTLLPSPPFPSARAQQGVCGMPFQPVATPLTELGENTYTRMDGQVTSFTGGLYPDGSNTRPPAHEAAGMEIASQVVPLNLDGQPDPNGHIVIISVGMSNVLAEWFPFIDLTRHNPQVNPRLFFINGAQGGQTAEKWVNPDAPTWSRVDEELARYDYSPEQVQVAWVKQTLTRGGAFPAKAQQLQVDLEAIAQNLKIHFPNIKIAYFSSRTRSYTYFRGLSPEPLAYETGFAVKWLIEKQINGDPALNFDPQQGEVRAPYLSWGPYLWIDGNNPRLDGRVWLAEDMTEDCTHPSETGSTKVAEMLLEFFLNDTVAASWFRADTAEVSVATATLPVLLTATPSETPPVFPTLTEMVPTLSEQTALVEPVVTTTPSDPVAPAAAPAPVPIAGYAGVAVLFLCAGLAVGWLVFRKK